MSHGFFRSPAPTADGRAGLHQQVTGDNKDAAAAHLRLFKPITGRDSLICGKEQSFRAAVSKIRRRGRWEKRRRPPCDGR